MSDELLPYYARELAILRTSAADFAQRHPKVAGRLRLGRDESQDPHVERLLQGVAFLAADVQKRLDDDFPELTDGLLDLLYPHYLRPMPSMTIVQMAIDRKQAALSAGYRVARGAQIETEVVDGDRCIYRTCFDLHLWPLRITEARLSGPPFRLPIVPPTGTIQTLAMKIETLSREVKIGQMPLGTLRFHLHAEAGQSIAELYELLLTRATGIVLSTGPDDPAPVLLPRTAIVAAGFEPEDQGLPADPRAFHGYLLLTEFFALPQKFLFVDLKGLTPEVLSRFEHSMEIAVMLTAGSRELERVVSPDSIRLGCTPAINLFSARFDPMRFDGTHHELCITPDARRPRSLEVYSVDSVHVSAPGETPVEVRPFYDQGAQAFVRSGKAERGTQALRWKATRRPHREPRPDGLVDAATDTWLSLVDENAGPAGLVGSTVHTSGTCTNRNLPSRLPFSVGRPVMTLRDGQGPIGSIECLVRPTAALRRSTGRGAAWRFVSHLSLNYLSLVDAGDGQAAAALREILGLYLHEELTDFDQRQRWIQAISEVSSRRVAARIGGARGGVCQGLEVRLLLDEDHFDDRASYLFSSVVDRFLGGWVHLNSFTRLVSTSRQRESRKEQWIWPPRSGSKALA
jgi:type VI secretion system protein ImpG